MSWSGGKDSARALYEIQQRGEYSVAALLSTITEGYDRVCMHGVRRELLERQAEAIGLPLEKIYIPRDATNGEYEARMQAVLERYRRAGVVSVAFGDIFLEDLRQYREKNLGQLGMEGYSRFGKRTLPSSPGLSLNWGSKRSLFVSIRDTWMRALPGRCSIPNSCNASPPALIPVEKTGSFIPSRSTVRSSPGGLSSSWGKPCGVTLSGLVICCLLNNLSKNLLERVGMRGL